jgi:hypothetical protein
MTPTTGSADIRAAMIRAAGATGAEIQELLSCNRNRFVRPPLESLQFPIPDEPFVAAWEGYADSVAASGTIEVLAGFFPQLWFPIRAGMSETPDYAAATRMGVDPRALGTATGLTLIAPDRCRLVLHQTPAGRIPILIVEHRDDFIALARALSRRNEPVPIPDSMGAVVVGGFNNWNRIAALRRKYLDEHPEKTDSDWRQHFEAAIKPSKELYQDRFLILSSGPYSAVPAKAMGRTPAEWNSRSLLIRCEHEAAHYFTRRVLGSMKNSLLDEVIADYYGIVGGLGEYRAEWFLLFLGLEHYPHYRAGGRLENYRGDPPLSSGAFLAQHWILAHAAASLETFDREIRHHTSNDRDKAAVLLTLAAFTLEELAHPNAPRWMLDELRRILDSLDSQRNDYEKSSSLDEVFGRH